MKGNGHQVKRSEKLVVKNPASFNDEGQNALRKEKKRRERKEERSEVGWKDGDGRPRLVFIWGSSVHKGPVSPCLVRRGLMHDE